MASRLIRRRCFALVTVMAGLAPAIRADDVLYRWFGDDQAGEFGSALANAGDVNGDGRDDIIVGIPMEDASAAITRAGSARVFSGADGSLLHDIDGSAKDDDFGWSVASAGDQDGDGCSEIVVGAFQLNGKGYVRVHDGATGALRFLIAGTSNLERFGHSVAGLGDVNGDGVPDFAAGGPFFDSSSKTDRGRVRVMSGVDASLVYEVPGSFGLDNLGMSLSAIGDVDGDGVTDFVGGGTRIAEVYSGKTGTSLARLKGDPNFNDGFGWSVAGLGDTDGDGVGDFAVSATQLINGTAYVYSGATRTKLFTVEGISKDHARAVGSAGDVDGDGRGDLLFGAPSEIFMYSHAMLYSGRTGRLLYRFESVDVDDEFGFAVGGAGDLDSDGFDDPIVGAAAAFHRHGSEGSATVFRGNDVWLQAEPWFAHVGDTITLSFRNGSPGSLFALFVTGLDDVPLFEHLGTFNLDSFGEWKLIDTVESDLFDHEFTLRAYALPASGSGKLLDSFDERVSIR